MEYVEGQSLDDLIHSVGHLSTEQTIALGRQICAGLAGDPLARRSSTATSSPATSWSTAPATPS